MLRVNPAMQSLTYPLSQGSDIILGGLIIQISEPYDRSSLLVSAVTNALS